MKKHRSNVLDTIHLNQNIEPRSNNQCRYFNSIDKNVFTFGVGHPGTGKTIISLWKAVLEILNPKSRISKIIIIRPCIQNRFGENIGSLPGELRDKMMPNCMSIIDNLNYFLNKASTEKLIEHYIEFVPLTLLRGRSLNNAFIIVEEAQNIKLSGKGVYMIMSRLGVHSKMVFNGDLAQSDLGLEDSALADAIERLDGMTGVGIVELYHKDDIQRHPLLHEIMIKFNEINEDLFN